MEFLDPIKSRRHSLRILVGYCLIAVAILMATTVLVYWAYGYGLKNGQVIQSGFVFVSSNPPGGKVYVNDVVRGTTNTRLTVESGQYIFKVKRSGYRNWQRVVSVQGGDVQRFDYPILYPLKPIVSTVKSYAAAPHLVSQSPDNRWLLVQPADSMTSFQVYDLKKLDQPPTLITLPANLFTSSKTTNGWELAEWSTDNQHVLLKHLDDDGFEYIMLDRQDASQSFNLNKTFNRNPTVVNLRDKAYDSYYFWDQESKQLDQANLADKLITPIASGVLAFKSYGTNVMLYATQTVNDSSTVSVKLLQNDQTYVLRKLPAGGNYLLDLTQFDRAWYVVMAATTDDKVFIYKDPVDQYNSSESHRLSVTALFKLDQPETIAFSNNAQFIMAEHGTSFRVYDNRYKNYYGYTMDNPLDSPQTKARWLDSDHLTYVSGGKQLIFDYDQTNRVLFATATPSYNAFLAPDTKHLLTVGPTAVDPGSSNQTVPLLSTALRVKNDL